MLPCIARSQSGASYGCAASWSRCGQAGPTQHDRGFARLIARCGPSGALLQPDGRPGRHRLGAVPRLPHKKAATSSSYGRLAREMGALNRLKQLPGRLHSKPG